MQASRLIMLKGILDTTLVVYKLQMVKLEIKYNLNKNWLKKLSTDWTYTKHHLSNLVMLIED